MSSGVVRLVPAGQEVAPEDPMLADFLAEVQQLQVDMQSMTGEDHISRLHRPGSKYFNMNPFEVLGLNHKVTVEEVKQAYRKISLKVHPDKNPGNERATVSFEIVKAAAERLEDEERYSFCVRICQAAEDATIKKVQTAKKKLRKDGAPVGRCLSSHQSTTHTPLLLPPPCLRMVVRLRSPAQTVTAPFRLA